jgi:hypothetical protein
MLTDIYVAVWATDNVQNFVEKFSESSFLDSSGYIFTLTQKVLLRQNWFLLWQNLSDQSATL